MDYEQEKVRDNKKIIDRSYKVSNDKEYIICYYCGMISYNHNDVTNKYCGNCNIFHDD